MVRILVGMPEAGARGGPPACEPPFNRELRRLGHQVEEETYSYAQPAGPAGRFSRVLRTAQIFRERLRTSPFDIVHINTAFDTKALLRDAYVIPRLRATGARIFLKVHGSDADLLRTKNPILAASRRRVLGSAAGLGVLSSEEHGNFIRAGLPENRVFVVKNVIEFEFENSAHRSNETPTILFISRLISAKGLLDVVHACALLRDKSFPVKLLCIGDGPARSDAEREVDSLNLRDRVEFLGHIPEEETAQYYSSCSALVFPTYHIEGFPIVIFKAAAAGLPIITTRIRAAADYLKEPDNCLWVEPRRPDLLADRILELLQQPKLRDVMAENNRALAKRLEAHPVALEYISIYNQIIDQTRNAK